MKNLAGDKDCDAEIITELSTAGIFLKQIKSENREVPASVDGIFGGWEFKRACCYWIAKAPYGSGISIAAVRMFNNIWRDVVRVNGRAGGIATEELHTPTIHTYHIDTQEGLNAFVCLLRALRRIPIKVE